MKCLKFWSRNSKLNDNFNKNKHFNIKNITKISCLKCKQFLNITKISCLKCRQFLNITKISYIYGIIELYRVLKFVNFIQHFFQFLRYENCTFQTQCKNSISSLFFWNDIIQIFLLKISIIVTMIFWNSNFMIDKLNKKLWFFSSRNIRITKNIRRFVSREKQ